MRPRWLISFFLFSCVQADAQANGQAPPDNFLSHPESLCTALEENGLHAGRWLRIGAAFGQTQMTYSYPSPYACEAPQWVHPVPNQPPPGPDSPGFSVLYRVSGDAETHADIITIAVTVHRPDSMDAGEEELRRDIDVLFKSIKQPLPAGLIPSISRHHYFRSRQAYGFVSFAVVVPERTADSRRGQQVLRFRIWK